MRTKKTRRRTGTGRAARAGRPGRLDLPGHALLWILLWSLPFVVLVTARDAFRLPKLMAAEWLGLASLVALGLAWTLAGPAPGGRRPWRSTAFAAIAPLVAVAALGLAVSASPPHTRQALFDLVVGASCLVGWSLLVDRLRLERLLAGMAVPAAVVAALAIAQFHDLYRPFAFASGEEETRLGLGSLAGNTGDLAAYLVLPALALQWWLARRLTDRPTTTRARTAVGGAVLALLVVFYALAVTQTITAVAALAVASAVLWLAVLPPRRRWLGAAALVGLAVLLSVAVPPLSERLTGAYEAAREGRLDDALTGRLDGWRAAVWMLESRPVAGVGHGAYRAEFGSAKLELAAAGERFYQGHADPYFVNAHNDLLEALAEWGSLGALALLWAIGIFVARGRGALRAATPADRGLLLGGGAALAVLAAGHFPFHVALVAYPFLVFLAWAARLGDEATEDGEVAAAAGDPSRGGRTARLTAGAVTVALAVLLVLQTERTLDRLGASRRLQSVEAVAAAAFAGRQPHPGLVAANLRVLKEARRLDPAEVGVPLALGSHYLLLGHTAPALAAYEEALALEERPEVWLNVGRAHQQAGRTEEARDAYARALVLDPALRREVPRLSSP